MQVIDFHVAGQSERYPRKASADDDFLQAQAMMTREAKTFWNLEWGRSPIPSLETYLERMGQVGVAKLVIHAAANRPDSCRELNERTARLCRDYPDRLVGLAAVPLPYPEEAVKEVEIAIKELGLRGLKIYPRGQRVTLDHHSLRPVLAKAAELGIPVLTHCTPLPIAYSGYHGPHTCIDNTSDNLARLFFSDVFSEVPNLKVIAAHFGGGMIFYKDFMEELNPQWGTYFDNIYFDLSGYPFSEKMIKAAIDIVGEDHLLFGSDFPLIGTDDVHKMISKIEGFDLSREVKDKILGGNAARLLGLDCA